MALKLILLREVGLRFAMASVFYVFFYEKLAHVRKKQYLCSRVAFGKLVAMNDARVIGRQLPPLSPKIENFRGPQFIN